CCPAVAEGVVVAEFSRGVAEIVADLKEGIFRDSYLETPSLLIFHNHGERAEVTEINQFGRDFLELCDGRTSCADIAEQLRPRHGDGVGSADFQDACCEALAALGGMGLVRNARDEAPLEVPSDGSRRYVGARAAV
ncbi:MAG TPA: hypothetical protein VF795_05460, partial [Desulfuromonadaceae bacterium]